MLGSLQLGGEDRSPDRPGYAPTFLPEWQLPGKGAYLSAPPLAPPPCSAPPASLTKLGCVCVCERERDP